MQAGRKPAANTATAAVPKPLRVAPGSSSGYAVGTIVESRSYEVRANIKGRAQSIFLQEGQYVRKGDILVKGWDYTFAVATTDAIVLKQLMAPGDYLQPSSPVALLAAVQPFRIALPIENTPRKVGDIVRLQGGPQGGQVATGVVVGSAVEGGRCILELRLRSLEHGLMLVGTSVRVETVTARQ